MAFRSVSWPQLWTEPRVFATRYWLLIFLVIDMHNEVNQLQR